MNGIHRLSLLAITAALSLFAVGCEDPDNCLEGSLGSVYDLSFDTVQARQALTSRQLAIEYVRTQGTGEEKPIMVTIMPTPDGPGTFTFQDRNVSIDNSLASGALLPELTSAEVDLNAFTPAEDAEGEGTSVRGAIHAQFTNAGNTYTLEGCFKTTLEIVP